MSISDLLAPLPKPFLNASVNNFEVAGNLTVDGSIITKSSVENLNAVFAPGGATMTANIIENKVGNIVNLVINGLTSTNNPLNNGAIVVNAINASFRPPQDVTFQVIVTDNGAQQAVPGRLDVRNNGTIVLYKTNNDTSLFSGGVGATGSSKINVSYGL